MNSDQLDSCTNKLFFLALFNLHICWRVKPFSLDTTQFDGLIENIITEIVFNDLAEVGIYL